MFHRLCHILLLSLLVHGVHAQPFYFGADLSYVNEMEQCGAVYYENGNPIKGIPRHPILENDVIVYSNATILGRIIIGKGATIGGNIWITENVPAGAHIVQQRNK